MNFNSVVWTGNANAYYRDIAFSDYPECSTGVLLPDFPWFRNRDEALSIDENDKFVLVQILLQKHLCIVVFLVWSCVCLTALSSVFLYFKHFTFGGSVKFGNYIDTSSM